MLIGELAARAGIAAPTIRYYESIGLLEPPVRSAAGYRRYAQRVLDELSFIRKAQALGFALEDIAGILRMTRAGETPCDRVLALAQEQLVAIDERIRQLRQVRDQLAQEIGKWDGQTTLTCEGLCQIIRTADIRVTAVSMRRRPL